MALCCIAYAYLQSQHIACPNTEHVQTFLSRLVCHQFRQKTYDSTRVTESCMSRSILHNETDSSMQIRQPVWPWPIQKCKCAGARYPVGVTVACRSLRSAIMCLLSAGAAHCIHCSKSLAASEDSRSALYSWLRPTHSKKGPSHTPSMLPQPCTCGPFSISHNRWVHQIDQQPAWCCKPAPQIAISEVEAWCHVSFCS